jgi:hypothetical protein
MCYYENISKKLKTYNGGRCLFTLALRIRTSVNYGSHQLGIALQIIKGKE